MRGVRSCVAAAAAILLMLGMTACSIFEDLEPPPLATALNPLPPPPAPPIPESATPPSPAEARAEIADWLSHAGYQPFQVTALLEHAKTESGFQACAIGAGDLSYLFQWGGTRLKRLHEFAHHSGCPRLKTQLAFADNELRNDPKFACFWDAKTEAAAYAALRRGFGRGSC